jgi:hypothetical protein
METILTDTSTRTSLVADGGAAAVANSSKSTDNRSMST